MATAKDQPYAAGGPHPNPLAAPLRGAALAAELLENACALGLKDPLRLEVVRTLARDLKKELEALDTLTDEETGEERFEGVEGALRAADVANLAACTLPELLKTSVPEAAAAAHLAAGAARALGALTETSTEDTHEYHAQNALKDARNAIWRARLATRQVDEFLEETG